MDGEAPLFVWPASDCAIYSKGSRFEGYDDIGRAELQFDDPFDPGTENYSHAHTIWVEPEFVGRYRATSRARRPGCN